MVWNNVTWPRSEIQRLSEFSEVDGKNRLFHSISPALIKYRLWAIWSKRFQKGIKLIWSGKTQNIFGDKEGHLNGIFCFFLWQTFQYTVNIVRFLQYRQIEPLHCTCFGSTYTKIGTIQRRLAWPLRKDDTQNREAFHIFGSAWTPLGMLFLYIWNFEFSFS